MTVAVQNCPLDIHDWFGNSWGSFVDLMGNRSKARLCQSPPLLIFGILQALPLHEKFAFDRLLFAQKT